jgi:H+/gluconate symporter-like permease
MLGIIGIILSLFLLIYFAYRGISVLILAPLMALLATVMNGDAPILATYTEVFMSNFAKYAKSYFPLFLLGAIFGKVMEDSGSAKAIANFISGKIGEKRAVLSIVLSCAILTYGGVSLFVVPFAVYPIAVALFKKSEIPKRLIPASIALGSFTFTMTALPGTPQIQNAIPMPFFGTNTYAAPIIGIVASIIMFTGGILWLNYRVNKLKEAGEGFGRFSEDEEKEEKELPKFFNALLPIIIVLGCNFYLSQIYFPSTDGEYLVKEPYHTTLAKVVGTWSLIISVSLGIISNIFINFKKINNIQATLNKGAMASLLAIINTCSEVGYGNVISSLPSFEFIKQKIIGVSDNPLISEALSIGMLAGITGSASGGMSIALGVLGDKYLELAKATNLNPEVLHRIASIACSSLDALPHNGAVITLLAICGLTHKESYPDIFAVTLVVPSIATIVSVILGSVGVV